MNAENEANNNDESDTQYNMRLLQKRINSLKHPIYPAYRLIYPLVCKYSIIESQKKQKKLCFWMIDLI